MIYENKNVVTNKQSQVEYRFSREKEKLNRHELNNNTGSIKK